MAGGDAQLADLAEWVGSDDAQQAARRALQRRGLPTGFAAEDLLHQTFLQIARRIQRRGPVEVEEGKTIAAYAVTSMRRIVIDILRGEATDCLGHIEARPADDAIPGVEDMADPANHDLDAMVVERLVSHDTIDALRLHLFARMDRQVWPDSAALSLVTLTTDAERHDQLGPRPEAGVEGLWRYWTALWLAGCSDVLPDREQEHGDDAARRKRRERAIARVKERIVAARDAIAGSEASP